MKNKLIDLNNHLFAQLERLSDESIDKEKLDNETIRAKHMALIARETTSRRYEKNNQFLNLFAKRTKLKDVEHLRKKTLILRLLEA